MRKKTNANCTTKKTMDTMELKDFLSCGRVTAVRIGTDAGAKITIGHRVLWNVDKVKRYLDEISGE